MSRARPRRRDQQRHRRPPREEYEEVDSEEEDAVSLLGDIRDIMLMILTCSCCPSCAGAGRAADGLRPDGSPNWTTCHCRIAARQVVEEFTGG